MTGKIIPLFLLLSVVSSGLSFAQSPPPSPSPTHEPFLTLKNPRKQKLQALAAVLFPWNLQQFRSFKQFDGMYSDLLNQKELQDYFQIHSNRFVPQVNHSLHFVNADEDFKGISDRKLGYCFGYATLFRELIQLTFFDPDHKIEAERGTRAWLRTYHRLLWKVGRGEAVVIPGFKDLREMSSDPLLELELKKLTMQMWKAHAVQMKSYHFAQRADVPMTNDELAPVIKNLEERLARHEFPKILFSALVPTVRALGLETDIHTVPVYKVEHMPQGSTRIYIWDEDLHAEELIQTPLYIELTPDGMLHYTEWLVENKPYTEYMGRIEIAPDNDEETVQQILALKAFCEQDENRPFCERDLKESLQK